jgi:hypothetical protein
VGDRFGADRLARAGRTGEVERQCEAGGMPLAQPPAVEDEIVLRDLRQRGVERTPCCRRQNDIGEAPARNDRFDGAA